MKKILYIWKDKYPWDVRVEKFCKSLSQSGFEILLLCRWKGELHKHESVDGINVRRACYGLSNLKSQPLSMNPYWKVEINNTIEDFNPDLMITREFFLTSLAKKSGKKKSIPVIMDMAEHYPAAMKDWKKYDTLIWRFLIRTLHIPDWYEKRAVSDSDGIITVCPEQSARLINEYHYPDFKMQVVHNTPYYDIKDLKKNNFNYFVFGHHGHMSAEKGLINFIKGFLLAAEINERLRLFLAGKGENFDEISSLVANSRFSDRITLFGEYNPSDLNKVMASFNIGIIPYQDNLFNNHTLHNKLFDYFRFAKPVMTSLIKPTKRVVTECSAGQAYDLSNANKVRDSILDFISLDLTVLSYNSAQASSIYNWEIDSTHLVSFINKYI